MHPQMFKTGIASYFITLQEICKRTHWDFYPLPHPPKLIIQSIVRLTAGTVPDQNRPRPLAGPSHLYVAAILWTGAPLCTGPGLVGAGGPHGFPLSRLMAYDPLIQSEPLCHVCGTGR